MKWVCLLVFGSVGLGAATAGLVWGAKRWKLQREGVKTMGTVVELSSSESTSEGRTSRSYYPQVEFQTAEGRSVRFQGSTGSSTPSYEAGQLVTVLYSQSDPSHAQIADFEQFWLGPVVLSIFGLIFLGAGVGGYFLIADSDKTFGPEFQARMDRARLLDFKKGIPLKTVVLTVRAAGQGKEPAYILVCRGGAPGGKPRDFESAPLSFDPGPGVVGKPVTVYADPLDPAKFYVHVEPLFMPPGP